MKYFDEAKMAEIQKAFDKTVLSWNVKALGPIMPFVRKRYDEVSKKPPKA